MSNIIKLLAVSVLLVGCQGMYDKSSEPKKMSKAGMSRIEKQPAQHAGNVSRDAANHASTVTTMYKNR